MSRTDNSGLRALRALRRRLGRWVSGNTDLDAPTRLATHWRDVVPCYLSVQDRDLRIVEANNLFRQDFGQRVGQYCYHVYKGRGSPCPECPVLKTFEDGQIHTGQEIVVTHDGQRAHVLVTSASFLVDHRGRTTAVMEMSTNITQVKTLEQELHQSKQYFQQLFDSVPCYISLQNHDFRIVETNQLFRQDFGDQSGKLCFQAYKGRASVCPDCPVEKTFADGQVHSSEELVVTRDGRRANMIVYSMPVTDEQGKIVSVMEVSTNITEVKHLQHQLAAMGLAVAGMAHRVKNILMGLEGGIFVVNTGMEEDNRGQIDDGWQMVERNVAKISRLVKDLLYCSKERDPSYSAGVSPAQIVRDVHGLYLTRTRQEGIELVLDLREPYQTGTFDPEGIQNMLANLTANAIDACRFDTTPDKAHQIRLSCRQDDTGITMLEVSDNGAGISTEHLEKVFKGFFSTKGTEGTGLGLLVVNKVVEEHKGTVSVRSAPGQGTTFTVSLRSAG